MNQRRWPLSATMNTRDLGGYPIATGGYTAWGQFLRSDLPLSVTESDLELLREAGITTVIDLRTELELRESPCALAGQPSIDYHNYSMLGEGWPDDPAMVPHTYFTMTRGEETVATVFHVMAAAPGGVIFHCRAGKDRTGVTAALLMLLAGVQDQDIVVDYQTTGPYLAPLFEKLQEEYKDFPMSAVIPYPEHMEGFLRLFKEEYQSAEAYLKKIGLSSEEIAKLKARMTNKA